MTSEFAHFLGANAFASAELLLLLFLQLLIVRKRRPRRGMRHGTAFICRLSTLLKKKKKKKKKKKTGNDDVAAGEVAIESIDRDVAAAARPHPDK